MKKCWNLFKSLGDKIVDERDPKIESNKKNPSEEWGCLHKRMVEMSMVVENFRLEVNIVILTMYFK